MQPLKEHNFSVLWMYSMSMLTLCLWGSRSSLRCRWGALWGRGGENGFSVTLHFLLIHPGGLGGGIETFSTLTSSWLILVTGHCHVLQCVFNWNDIFMSVCICSINVLTSESEASFSFRACCPRWHCPHLHEPSPPGETQGVRLHMGTVWTASQT